MKYFILIIVLFNNAQLWSQENCKIAIEGKYQGENLYFQNPNSDLVGKSLCIKQILINKKDYTFNSGRAVQIRLDSMNFSIGDSLHVEIIHYSDCKPKIITGNGIHPNKNYITKIYIDSISNKAIKEEK